MKDCQTVMFEARPIGFWARVVATFVDDIIVIIVTILLVVVGGLLGGPLGMVMGVLGIGDAELIADCGALIVTPISLICVPWLYRASMEASKGQATLGKLLIGAKVVDANGGRLTFGRATRRYFAKYLSALPMQIGYIMVAFDWRKRGLHDMIAGTFVISRRNYATGFKYRCNCPQRNSGVCPQR